MNIYIKSNNSVIARKGLIVIFLSVFLLQAGFSFIAQSAHATSMVLNHILISEIFYDTPSGSSSEEWIELYNPTSAAVDISEYGIGDEETECGGEGMFRFPAGSQIAAGKKIVIAVKAGVFFNLYGIKPDFEISESDPDVPNLIKLSSWATGSINLGNSGDEILLLNENNSTVDVVVYEQGSFSGIVPHPGVAKSHSLERYPGNKDTDDCGVDFIDQAAPNPETNAELQPIPPPPPPVVESDFLISSSPSTISLEQGQSGSTTINLTSIGGFNSEVAISAWGMPSGTTWNFSPSGKFMSTGSAKLNVKTSTTTSVGSYLVLITGVGGGKFRSCYINLKVTTPPVDSSTLPDFVISATPQEQIVIPAEVTTFSLNLNPINGFSSPVNLGVYGLPPGSTYSFNPNSVTPTGQSILTVNTTSQADYGTYLALITARSLTGEIHFCYIKIRVVPFL